MDIPFYTYIRTSEIECGTLIWNTYKRNKILLKWTSWIWITTILSRFVSHITVKQCSRRHVCCLILNVAFGIFPLLLQRGILIIYIHYLEKNYWTEIHKSTMIQSRKLSAIEEDDMSFVNSKWKFFSSHTKLSVRSQTLCILIPLYSWIDKMCFETFGNRVSYQCLPQSMCNTHCVSIYVLLWKKIVATKLYSIFIHRYSYIQNILITRKIKKFCIRWTNFFAQSNKFLHKSLTKKLKFSTKKFFFQLLKKIIPKFVNFVSFF